MQRILVCLSLFVTLPSFVFLLLLRLPFLLILNCLLFLVKLLSLLPTTFFLSFYSYIFALPLLWFFFLWFSFYYFVSSTSFLIHHLNFSLTFSSSSASSSSLNELQSVSVAHENSSFLVSLLANRTKVWCHSIHLLRNMRPLSTILNRTAVGWLRFSSRLLPVQPSQFSECASTSLIEPPVNNSDQIVNGALSTLNIYTANLLL